MKQKINKGIMSLLLWFLFLIACPFSVHAGTAGGEGSFRDLTWEKVLEAPVKTKSGVVQSICATENYIICMENSGDASGDNDIVYAYYKNPWDENGNPVEQYSLAFYNDSFDWEHCNGMCYNRDQDEIYVALYTNHTADNRGCIYVMDPHTLDFKRSIKLGYDYNVLGIGYYAKKGMYLIQTNDEAGYSVKILDGEFTELKDLGPVDLAQGSNSQDMCVCGQYLINFPLTFDQAGKGSYMNVYDIDYGRADDPDDYEISIDLIDSIPMDLQGQGKKKVEPESICEVEDGVFLVTVNIMDGNGKRKFAWYRTELPFYRYEVRTSCQNGTITSSDADVMSGSEFRVTYTPDDGYELNSVMVDGNYVDINEYPAAYQFTDVRADHRVDVVFSPVSSGEGAAVPAVLTPQDPSAVKEKKTGWKLILILLLLLALAVFGLRKYNRYLQKERRKKQLQSKIRKEREKQALRKAMEDLEQPVESISLEEALREIEEMEGRKSEKKPGKQAVKKRRK